jgi:hypothetical protein
MHRIRPDTQEVRALAAHALGDDIEVNPVDEGVATYVYRIERSGDAFYLRVLPEEGSTVAPEVQVHAILQRSGVQVPEVVYWDDCDRMVARAVMITREIKGRAIGKDKSGTGLPAIVRAAGRDLALVNQVPVDGFGWVRREAPGDARLQGEVASEREFMLADLELCLHVLQAAVLQKSRVDHIRAVVEKHASLLDAPHASLAHGGFDATHIFSYGGRYTGIIDLGEMRGTGPHYDLGHFRFHDGETLPTPLLSYLLEGYRDMVALCCDADRRIIFDSLPIGVRFLARVHKRLARWNRRHAITAIERELRTLDA